jgi:hypothetical protein
MNLQKPIFETGSRYLVKKSFISGPSTFIAGEIVVFTCDGYSHYDNSFVYEFHSQGDGKDKTWWLHKDEPAEMWKQFFELLGK